MTDDIIRSMKEQMVPSDDVVSDLLAKIAACEASPETMDNVDSFEAFRNDEIADTGSKGTASQAKKFTTKSIWFYGTAAAASVIVLLSVFSVFGGSDPSDIRNVVDGLIDNPNVIVTPGTDSDNDPSGNPDDSDAVSGENEDKENEDSKDSEKGGFWSNLFGKDDKDSDTNKDNDNKQGNGNENTKQPSNNDDPNNGNSNVVTPPAPPDNSNTVTPPEEDDSKVTPGAPGEADIS